MSEPGFGHNSGPFETFGMALDDAYSTAKDFLDGTPIETQGQADQVGRILSEVRKLKKDADAARRKEKRPHHLASLAVDAKWKPLDERCDAILAAAQGPLTAYLTALAERQRAAETKAREEANVKAREAVEAARALAISTGGMEALARVQQLEREADRAAKIAQNAGKQKAHVAGMDRAISLRTYKVATVTNRRMLLNWVAGNDPAALGDWLTAYAQKALPAELPGVEIRIEKRAA